jgi:hypothetical protein
METKLYSHEARSGASDASIIRISVEGQTWLLERADDHRFDSVT